MAKIIVSEKLSGYFFDKLNRSNRKTSYPLSQEMIWYSSHVLESYMESHKFFDCEDGKVRDKILGTKLLELDDLTLGRKKEKLKEVGDSTLILCGFFGESIKNKITHESYYRNLGKTAYSSLNSYVPKYLDIPSFYKKVSESFEHIVSLIEFTSKEIHANFSRQPYHYLEIDSSSKVKN